MDTIRWSPSTAVCPHGSTASPTPVASRRTARPPRSPIRRATSTYRPTPAAVGRAEPKVSHPRAAASSPEQQQKACRNARQCLLDEGRILPALETNRTVGHRRQPLTRLLHIESAQDRRLPGGWPGGILPPPCSASLPEAGCRRAS